VGVVSRGLDATERFFFAPRAIHALVLGRIIFGLSLFLCYVNRLPDVPDLYGPAGLLGPELATRLDSENLYGNAPAFAAWTNALRAIVPAPSLAATWVLTGTLLASSLAFALGFFTRSAGFVALVLHHFFVTALAPYSYWGWSLHIQPLMAYLLCAPTGRFLSIDAWLARRRSHTEALPISEWTAPAWPLRLIQIHTCCMYAVSGWARVDDPGWLNGEAVFDAVSVALHAKFAIDWQPFKTLLTIGTYAALLLEGLAPLCLWMGTLGTLFAYALIAMHGSLELTTNLGWWSHIMIASLLCFVPSAHLQQLIRKLPVGLRGPDPVPQPREKRGRSKKSKR